MNVQSGIIRDALSLKCVLSTCSSQSIDLYYYKSYRLIYHVGLDGVRFTIWYADYNVSWYVLISELHVVIYLQIFKSNGLPLTLLDNNIPPYATLYLVVLLYAIPEAFDHVVFDLYWGYPYSGRDYLDASCLVYQGTQFLYLADYRKRNLNGITHSGDVMNDYARTGHHTIHVYLKQLPNNVTHLFFTLSAWNSPNIAKYPNPSLKFYEASNTKKDLCKTTFTHAGNSQAVVMCSVSKNSLGRWEIYESGKLSAGNARHYAQLKSTISNLIKTGY